MKEQSGNVGTRYSVNGTTRTITLTDYSTINIEEIYYIYNITTDKLYFSPGTGLNKISSISTNTIVISAAVGDTMTSTDKIHIQLVSGIATDEGLDVIKTTVQNPIHARYTDAENLVTASDIGASDGVYVDQGSEIDCRGYKTIGVFVNFTQNTSTTNTLKILSKHESEGSDEYVLETEADYIKTLGDDDIKIAYFFNVESIPYIQIQSAAADVADSGDEGALTIDIVKEY